VSKIEEEEWVENVSHHKIISINLLIQILTAPSSSKLKSCYLFTISFIFSHWYRVWQVRFTHIKK